MSNESAIDIDYKLAIEKYPMLETMQALDLVVLRKESVGIDEDFRLSIDAVLSHNFKITLCC